MKPNTSNNDEHKPITLRNVFRFFIIISLIIIEYFSWINLHSNFVWGCPLMFSGITGMILVNKWVKVKQ